MTKRPSLHSHMWIFGLAGMIAGLTLLVYAPSLRAISRSLLLFAGFHIVGALVFGLSVYLTWLRGRIGGPPGAGASPAFGAGPDWLNGQAIAGLAVGGAAVAIQAAAPALWPAAFVLLATAVAFFAGNLVVRGFRRRQDAVLPLVELFIGPPGLVLDVGCGDGRATVALGRGAGKARIVAMDQFPAIGRDARRGRLDRNLGLAGLADRVTVEAGDLVPLPFEDALFDAVVGANVYDHRGGDRARAMSEVFRVLKPGRRFLMTVRVPGWPMFAALSLLSLFLASPRAWRAVAAKAGFTLIDEGNINNAWFVLLERPPAP